MLPAALAIAALALLLGFATWRTAATALVLAAAAALVTSGVTVPPGRAEPAFIGCWGSVFAASLLCWLPRTPPRGAMLAVALAAGAFAGLAIAAEGRPGDLPRAALAALLIVPATVATRRGLPVVPRVVAGWLTAVALLAAVLPQVVAHPGYVADHRE